MNQAWPILLRAAVLMIPSGIIGICYKLQTRMAPAKSERVHMASGMWLAAGWAVLSVLLYGVMFFRVKEMEIRFWSAWGWSTATYISYLMVLAIIAKLTFRDGKQDKKDWGANAGDCYQLIHAGTNQEQWVLKPGMVPYQKLAQIVSRFLLVVCLIAPLFIGASYTSFVESSLWFILPVVTLIVVHALELFLDGNLVRISGDKVSGEGCEGVAHSQYHQAARHLQQVFADALLVEPQQKRSRKKSAGPEEILAALEKSDQMPRKQAAAYFRSAFPHQDIDPDYALATVSLVEKENIIIFNPFYRDLGQYLFFPFTESLTTRRKVLVLCAGTEGAGKVTDWMDNLLDKRASFQERWKIRLLEDLVPDCDVGILRYADLSNSDVLKKNEAFFAQCEYVLLLSPSQVLGTLQVPMSVLAGQLKQGVKPVFCILDRELNGLKDTISHVLQSRFDKECVIADQAQIQTIMVWDAQADFQAIERFERETRSLGGGVELAAEAVSIQIPQVSWISEKNVPLHDILNHAVRSYQSVCRWMQIPAGQNLLREKLKVRTSLWEQPRQKDEFLIVEDEYQNPFATARLYSSRGREEVFINVLSQDYLLRDYFCANVQTFMEHPDAIRSLVPAYAKTERNVFLKLILKMNMAPLSLQEISEEFTLGGFQIEGEEELLCLLHTLRERYTFAPAELFQMERVRRKSYSGQPDPTIRLTVDPDLFDRYFAHVLKNASYVLEDEMMDRHPLNAKLYSLIPQIVLPGQHLTYEGKNYMVKHISAFRGVVLHRASDLAESRKSYRQYRAYQFDHRQERPYAYVEIDGCEFSRWNASFTVDTLGYQETTWVNGQKEEKDHRFSISHTENQVRRSYKNKSILTIHMPSLSNEAVGELAWVLQNLLITVLPEDHPYLAILGPETKDEGTEHKDSFYFSNLYEAQTLLVIEDSELDLGLLEIVEKYFFDWLRAAQDYICWKGQPVEIEEDKQPETAEPSFASDSEKSIQITEDQPEKTEENMDAASPEESEKQGEELHEG